MTATAYRIYTCPHCPDTFTNPAVLGGHVHSQHPEHKRRAPKWLREATPARSSRPSLKRATDTWPGKP